MRQIFYIIALILSLLSYKSISQTYDKKAQSVFNMNLTIVENYFIVGYVEDYSCLNRAIDFLEKISEIKCNVPAEYLTRYEPTNKNIQDWKTWFNRNKNKIYWDDKENKVKIKT